MSDYTMERIADALERLVALLEAQQAALPREVQPAGKFLKGSRRA